MSDVQAIKVGGGMALTLSAVAQAGVAGIRLPELHTIRGYYPTLELSKLVKAGLVERSGVVRRYVYRYTGKPFSLTLPDGGRTASKVDMPVEVRVEPKDELAARLERLELSEEQRAKLKTYAGGSRSALARELGLSKVELNHILMLMKGGKPRWTKT